MYETKQLPTNLDNAAQFRLSKTKEMENYLIAEMNEKEKISKVLNNYITLIGYAHLLLSLLHLLVKKVQSILKNNGKKKIKRRNLF